MPQNAEPDQDTRNLPDAVSVQEVPAELAPLGWRDATPQRHLGVDGGLLIDGVLVAEAVVDTRVRHNPPLPPLPANIGKPACDFEYLEDGTHVLSVVAGGAELTISGRYAATEYAVTPVWAASGDLHRDEQLALATWASAVFMREVDATDRVIDKVVESTRPAILARITTDAPIPSRDVAAALGIAEEPKPTSGVQTLGDLPLTPRGDGAMIADLGFGELDGYREVTITVHGDGNYQVRAVVDVPASADQVAWFRSNAVAAQALFRRAYGADLREGPDGGLQATYTFEMTEQTTVAGLSDTLYADGQPVLLGHDVRQDKTWVVINSLLPALQDSHPHLATGVTPAPTEGSDVQAARSSPPDDGYATDPREGDARVADVGSYFPGMQIT